MSENKESSSLDWLSDVEYKALQDLYHNFHTAFIMLPDYIVKAYFTRLLNKEVERNIK